jgi:hypothetical protein
VSFFNLAPSRTHQCGGVDDPAMKRKTSVTNVWLTQRLNMGVPQGVSRYVGVFRSAGGERKMAFKALIATITDVIFLRFGI